MIVEGRAEQVPLFCVGLAFALSYAKSGNVLLPGMTLNNTVIQVSPCGISLADSLLAECSTQRVRSTWHAGVQRTRPRAACDCVGDAKKELRPKTHTRINQASQLQAYGLNHQGYIRPLGSGGVPARSSRRAAQAPLMVSVLSHRLLTRDPRLSHFSSLLKQAETSVFPSSHNGRTTTGSGTSARS